MIRLWIFITNRTSAADVFLELRIIREFRCECKVFAQCFVCVECVCGFLSDKFRSKSVGNQVVFRHAKRYLSISNDEMVEQVHTQRQ